MRKTKIVATVGPACESDANLKALIEAGADVLRINASHTSPEGIRQWVRRIRRAEKALKKSVAILVDLQGPRVRTGKLQGGKPLALKQGTEVTLEVSSSPGSQGYITTLCKEFMSMIKKGDRVLLDNGAIELRVLKTGRKKAECGVVRGGLLGQNKGINLPNAPVTLPALGLKDIADLKAAVEMEADYLALSFVRSHNDINTVKKVLKKHGSSMPVIAKIEKPRAVSQIRQILETAGGIMVARGDLGIEMGVEKVPVVQKELIEESNRRRLPVITATQMLESMMENPHPTRAEASDIANAVFDGTDAVMLSGETSIGKYAIEAVKTMSKIIRECERHIGESDMVPPHDQVRDAEGLLIDAIVHAARHAAKDLKAKAVAVFTRTGKTATLLSKYRPVSQIVAFAPSDQIARQMALFRGILPLKVSYTSSMAGMMDAADRWLAGMGLLKKGDPIVTLSGKKAFPHARYTTQIHRIS